MGCVEAVRNIDKDYGHEDLLVSGWAYVWVVNLISDCNIVIDDSDCGEYSKCCSSGLHVPNRDDLLE